MDGLDHQYHIICDSKDIGRYVICPGDPDRVEKIAELLDNPYFVTRNREFTVWSGYLEGELVTVCSTGIGAPSATIMMEEMHNMGADTFIRCGTCGGIAPDVKAGDVVIATAAVRYEHTSQEYAPVEFPATADFDITFELARTAVDLHYYTHVGIVQCKDSFYGQHNPLNSANSAELVYKWEAWKKLGVLASEMESSALFVCAANRHLRCGACFHVVWNQEREAAGLPQKRSMDTSKAVKLAVEAMRKVIVDDHARDYNMFQHDTSKVIVNEEQR